MEIYIDNKNLKTYFGIDCLDYTAVMDFPAERENERVWNDKSGVDKNLENIKYDSKEFVLSCICKANSLSSAYALLKTLVDYMYTKGVFVLSLRDIPNSFRECYLCERSGTIVNSINIREQNSLFYFRIGLKDVNPNAVKYKTTIDEAEVTISYTKGQTAVIYWGNGDRGIVSNSGNYTKDDYAADGLVDIIVDIDNNAPTVTPLIAAFTADQVSGIKPFTVNFTDQSTGTVEIYSWDFGDGNTSAEQNPQHIYASPGVYTVTLQIFNSAKGYSTEIKTNYITVRNAWMMINDTDRIMINGTDIVLTN